MTIHSLSYYYGAFVTASEFIKLACKEEWRRLGQELDETTHADYIATYIENALDEDEYDEFVKYHCEKLMQDSEMHYINPPHDIIKSYQEEYNTDEPVVFIGMPFAVDVPLGKLHSIDSTEIDGDYWYDYIPPSLELHSDVKIWVIPDGCACCK